VSKEKEPELYYLRLLQLYLPWRIEDDFIHSNGSYTSKFDEVKDSIHDIIKEFEPYDEITSEDLENAYVSSDEDSSDDDSDLDSDNEFSIFNPDILDFDTTATADNRTTTSSNIIRDLSMPNDQFYGMCKDLNTEQRTLFNHLIKFTQRLLHSESNDMQLPQPFYTHLSGGGGVGKSHTTMIIYEYFKRMLKYPGQSLNQPSVILTASTGAAASRISGTSLHSAFKLPVRNSMISKIKLSDKDLDTLHNEYKYLKVLIIDEISMIGFVSFHDLNSRLQAIMMNDHDVFGGVSILAVGDFLQLPPVKQNTIFSDPKQDSYLTFAPHLWKYYFKLHELTEILRQVDDPVFAALVSRVRIGAHTPEDIIALKALENTDTTNWPKQHVHLYLTNRLSLQHNEKELKTLPSEKLLFWRKIQ
jgi:hypothetical protein